MGYPTDGPELPREVQQQLRSLETAIRAAANNAIADCPDVERIAIKVDVGLKPFNFPINLTITNTGD